VSAYERLMNWTTTDEQVRELARVLRIEMGSFLAHDPAHPDRFWTIPARAMLAAVGPMIAAQALRDYADTFPHPTGGRATDVREYAEQIEKEAGR
jgi:hypothetical protein